jgi:hypothetical protein
LLPGGTNQFPGGSDSRCGPSPFHGAPGFPTYQEFDLIDEGLRDDYHFRVHGPHRTWTRGYGS